MTKFSVSSWFIVVAAIASTTSEYNTVDAFTVVKPQSSSFSSVSSSSNQLQSRQIQSMLLHAEERAGVSGAISNIDDDDEDEDEDDDLFDKVELLGKGAAKVKRGKRKGAAAGSSTTVRPKAALAPEETYYEGPPAITETIVPTISILTVVGIIPAAAAWARQAWVRYKITSRRIRVQSGFNGSEMAEIVYPDIIEIRTAKRLFGDGDMVAFLRDGAKFEMRNIPNFEEAMEFILKQVDPEVAKTYREKGDVTRPNE